MSESVPHPVVRRAMKRVGPTSVLTALAALGLSLAPTTAGAHHSFAMFDNAKTITVVGTVEQFRWQMPHVWIHMELRQPDGEVVKWAGECHAPNIIARKGWNRETLKAGDRISVTMHPMRNGSSMGSVISIELANGKVLWNAESKDSF